MRWWRPSTRQLLEEIMATVADISTKLDEVNAAVDVVVAEVAALKGNQGDPAANQAVVDKAEAIRAKLAAL